MLVLHSRDFFFLDVFAIAIAISETAIAIEIANRNRNRIPLFLDYPTVFSDR